MTTENHGSVHAGLRAWARGMYTTEAAVELLIRSGRALYPAAPWLTQRSDGKIALDFDQLDEAAGAWSGGERALVAIAVSLVDPERPVQLGDEIARLDRDDVALVLAAIAHTSGSHQHSGLRHGADGRPVGIVRHDTLYPWPQDVSDPA